MSEVPQDVMTVIGGMTSESESRRKLAVYHLQSLLLDSSFADAFIQAGGLPVLGKVVLEEHGNTLAYALGSLAKLLEMDLGWDDLNAGIIQRAVELVVQRPVINVLRNALFLLVLVVSRPSDEPERKEPVPRNSMVGFEALKPMLQTHETFLDALVERLASADHALCANALHLINALMRDSIMSGQEDEWPSFTVRLQELGVVSMVEGLMKGEAVADLAGPILEFQDLTKVLLRRWKAVQIDMEAPGHQSALDAVRALGLPHDYRALTRNADTTGPSVWRDLGFSSEAPVSDFANTGFLGLMDLSEHVRKHTNSFQKALLEQSVWPEAKRCPLARASLSVTAILYDHFNVSVSTEMEATTRALETLNGETSIGLEKVIQPMLLRWERVHAEVFDAFVRLWRASEATLQDFHNIETLVKVLVRRVVGTAGRKTKADDVELQLTQETLATVRNWQLEDFNETYEHAWGDDLRRARDKLHDESLQFMREQRVRCLMQGAWFPVIPSSTSALSRPGTPTGIPGSQVTSWRFVQLAPSRRYLHYASHSRKPDADPAITDLHSRIDLNTVSAVVSNVAATELPDGLAAEHAQRNQVAAANGHKASASTITKLTIHGASRGPSTDDETVLLELYTASPMLASEWLDGLLMLLNQQPITADTNRLVKIMADWSLKVRMLNLQMDDVDWRHGDGAERVVVPSREGLDTNYWYDMGET